MNKQFGSGFLARKHFTATFSCSNAYTIGDKVNVNANFRHLLRCIILHPGPKSIEGGVGVCVKTQHRGKPKIISGALYTYCFGFTLKSIPVELPGRERRHLFVMKETFRTVLFSC